MTDFQQAEDEGIPPTESPKPAHKITENSVQNLNEVEEALTDAKDTLVPVGGESVESFATFIHQYHRDYIALADTKSAFVFAISSGFITYLLSHDALLPLTHPWEIWTLHDCAGMLSLILFAIGAWCTILVVAPRLPSSNSEGIIFWEEIRKFSSGKRYARQVMMQSDRDIIRNILEHIYILAGIADAKYGKLKAAIYISATGLIFSFIFVSDIFS